MLARATSDVLVGCCCTTTQHCGIFKVRAVSDEEGKWNQTKADGQSRVRSLLAVAPVDRDLPDPHSHAPGTRVLMKHFKVLGSGRLRHDLQV